MKFHSKLLQIAARPSDGDLDRGLFFNNRRAAGVHHRGKKAQHPLAAHVTEN